MVSDFYKDFGYGFYCTKNKRQARKWALTLQGERNAIVSIYNYTPQKELKVLSFNEMTDEWLDFMVQCRHGIGHEYDIVEGPMVDDQIWDCVEDFMEGTITREAFWILVKFKHPTHQIVFCTEQSLKSVKYIESFMEF